MKKQLAYIAFLFPALLFSVCLHGQNLKVVGQLTDSLERGVKPRTQISIYNELAFQFAREDSARARSYVMEALRLSDSIGDLSAVDTSYNCLGTIARYWSAFDEAKLNYRKALKIRSDRGDHLGQISCYNNLGNVYKNTLRFDSAMLCYEAAFAIISGHGITRHKSIVLNNLGEVYQKQGLFARALATYDSVLQIRQNMDQNIPRNRTRLARAHLNLASVFIDVREYLQARDHLQIAYAIFKEEEDLSGLGKCSILLGNVAFFQSDLEEAEVIYKNTLEAYTEFLEPVDQAKVLRNLGSVMMRKGDTGKASEYYRQSEPYFAVSRDSHLMASIAYERGNVFIQSDQLDSALYYYANSGRLLAEGDLQTATLLYAQLAEAHLEKGDSATALAFLQKYQEAFQGLSNAERDVIHYQLKEEKLNRELAESKNEVLLFRSGLLITGLILVLLIAGIIVYRSRQARQRAKKEVDEMIQSVEMKIEKAQSQAQEMERKRISDELHDSVGSQLTAIRYNYEAIIQKLAELKKEVKSEFSMNTQKLAAVQEEVRSLSHELKEGFWEKFGLITRLQAFRDEMNAAGGIEVELSLFGLKERLNDETERQVYPIIQELTANALKHSKAKLLSIQLSAFEDSLSIMVEDDGVGFDLENALTKPGLGLENLKERVESLQGNLKIDSRPGRGTTVMIEEIPLPKIG